MKEPILYLPELEGYQVSHTKNHSIFENTNFTKPLNVREENMIMFGGLDTFSSLNSLEHFDSRNVAVIFADQNLKSIKSNEFPPSKIIMNSKNDILLQFLGKDSIVINPFKETKTHRPAEHWSRAASNDPFGAPFHSYLEERGIRNWDFDYSKNLVFTWAFDKLDIPLEIKTDEDYQLYARVLQNKEGGLINIHLDNKVEKKINTKSQIDEFVWQNLGVLQLTSGKHVLSIENYNGLNAVNLLVLIPTKNLPQMENMVNTKIEGIRLIYPLEAEYSFNSKGKILGEEILFNKTLDESKISKTFSNQLMVPDGTSQLLLTFLATPKTDLESFYKINDITIEPIYDEFIFDSKIPNGLEWINKREKNQNLSIEKLQDGKTQVKVNVLSTSTAKKSTITTDFIKVDDSAFLNYYVKLVTKEIEYLRSNVRYYDENKNLILKDNFFPGNSGTFQKEFETSYRTPPKTEYIMVEFSVNPFHPERDSSYVIEELVVNQRYNSIFYDKKFQSKNLDSQKIKLIDNNETIFVQGNSLKKIETFPIPVTDNLMLNFSININAENIDLISSKVFYLNDSITVQEDKLANNQEFLQLSPESSAYTNLDLLKNSEYTIAVKARNCEKCENIQIKIGNAFKEFAFKDDMNNFQWLYLTSNLTKGDTVLSISSKGEIHLDSVYVYSDSFEGEDLSKLFKVTKNFDAKITYNEINPTLFQVGLTNNEPFMLAFAEEYDPLWRAIINGKEYAPIPLFSTINGFWIEDGSTKEIKIEYSPQKWYYFGIVITLSTLFFSIIYSIWKIKILNLLKTFLKTSSLQHKSTFEEV